MVNRRVGGSVPRGLGAWLLSRYSAGLTGRLGTWTSAGL